MVRRHSVALRRYGNITISIGAREECKVLGEGKSPLRRTRWARAQKTLAVGRSRLKRQNSRIGKAPKGGKCLIASDVRDVSKALCESWALCLLQELGG